MQAALAWILVGQAHAVAGRRSRAGAAADEALRLAPDEPEVAGLAWGTCRGLASLLADDRVRAVEQIGRGADELRRLPRISPLPPWYLWPLLLVIAGDAEADVTAASIDRAEAALAETDDAALRAAAGPDALWQAACAALPGRRGDRVLADTAWEEADGQLAALGEPFAGYRHLAGGSRPRWRSSTAGANPRPGSDWPSPGFTAHGLDEAAAGCRRSQTRAGVPQRRRRKGDIAVPSHLASVGVTGREVDVLRLLAQGRSNQQIAADLHLGLRTVKTHVEHLLAKTRTANRTELAALMAAPFSHVADRER
jgi:DNA-binding CsgD family transcriptional regulator